MAKDQSPSLKPAADPRPKMTEEEKQARRDQKRAILDTEDSKARFKRLAQDRLEKALDGIALIGNLSGPNYEYSDGQVKFIRDKLEAEVTKACDRFKPKTPKDEREKVEIPE